MIDCKTVKSIEVLDPDTNMMVEVLIVKLETGGMVGIDESYLSNTDEPVYSPYDKNTEIDVSEV